MTLSLVSVDDGEGPDDLALSRKLALLHTDRSVVERGVEGRVSERSNAAQGWIRNVNKPVATFEAKRLLADDRGRNCGAKHTISFLAPESREASNPPVFLMYVKSLTASERAT